MNTADPDELIQDTPTGNDADESTNPEVVIPPESDKSSVADLND